MTQKPWNRNAASPHMDCNGKGCEACGWTGSFIGYIATETARKATKA